MNSFPKSKRASSNYGIGYDGKVGMYVEEKDRSWCTSSASNDHRAITIEVASDTKHPYKVTDKAYESLIDLLTDICERNKIKKLLWKADKSLIGQVDKQNMTVHRWFAAKECPGDYLYNLHSDIARRVNERLQKESARLPYKIRVLATSLNVRNGPSINHRVVTSIRDKGIYTITEENNGWGKLKSGVGWIRLSYTRKIY